MKRLATLIVPLFGVLLLAAFMAPLANTAPPPKAKAPAAYRYYVACGLSRKAAPAHACPEDREKGAFFRSNVEDVVYAVCVKFPAKKKQLCASHQKAVVGTLYVNEITSNVIGEHTVTWFVKGKKVGVFKFDVAAHSGGHGAGK